MPHFFANNLPATGFNYDSELEPSVASPTAIAFAKATLDMFSAQQVLLAAKKDIPSYTGQWSDADYLRDARETWARAATQLEQAMLASQQSVNKV